MNALCPLTFLIYQHTQLLIYSKHESSGWRAKATLPFPASLLPSVPPHPLQSLRSFNNIIRHHHVTVHQARQNAHLLNSIHVIRILRMPVLSLTLGHGSEGGTEGGWIYVPSSIPSATTTAPIDRKITSPATRLTSRMTFKLFVFFGSRYSCWLSVEKDKGITSTRLKPWVFLSCSFSSLRIPQNVRRNISMTIRNAFK